MSAACRRHDLMLSLADSHPVASLEKTITLIKLLPSVSTAQATHALLFCRVLGGKHCNDVASLPRFCIIPRYCMYACYLLAAGWLGHLGSSLSLPTHTFFFCLSSTFETFPPARRALTPHPYGINALGSAAVKANSDFSKASESFSWNEIEDEKRDIQYDRKETKINVWGFAVSVWELQLWGGFMGELLGWLGDLDSELLKDHVTLKTGVMLLKIRLFHHRNTLYIFFKNTVVIIFHNIPVVTVI